MLSLAHPLDAQLCTRGIHAYSPLLPCIARAGPSATEQCFVRPRRAFDVYHKIIQYSGRGSYTAEASGLLI